MSGEEQSRTTDNHRDPRSGRCFRRLRNQQIGRRGDRDQAAGFPTDATENAVQASLLTAGYTGNNNLVATLESEISLRAHANGRYVDAGLHRVRGSCTKTGSSSTSARTWHT